jgi:hypothetical protein
MCKEKKNGESLYKASAVSMNQNLPPDATGKSWELLTENCVSVVTVFHTSILLTSTAENNFMGC